MNVDIAGPTGTGDTTDTAGEETDKGDATQGEEEQEEGDNTTES